MTIKQLAEYLQLPVATLYQMAQEGRLPAAKVGRHWRFQRELVDEWLRARSTLAQRRVLVVDDDQLVRQTFRDSLEMLGCQVAEASDGEEALRIAAEQKLDLVFVDLILPGMDGAEVLRELRQRGCQAHAVMITAYPDSAVLTEALKQGSITLLRKPIGVADIQRTAATLLRLADA
ncbi:MAG: response regulator [Armatimonadota bacterium]|nr:response regulator [Armatimonadota bacterium]